MSDELLMQLTSNSNPTDNSSLTTKLAKLEARMAGKGSSSSAPSIANASQKLPLGPTPTMEAMQGVMYSSDSDEDVRFSFDILIKSSFFLKKKPYFGKLELGIFTRKKFLFVYFLYFENLDLFIIWNVM